MTKKLTVTTLQVTNKGHTDSVLFYLPATSSLPLTYQLSPIT
jgi:hypothetical protein